PVQPEILCRLQALHDQGRRDGHAARGTDIPSGRTHRSRRPFPRAVRRRLLLRGGDSDLRGRPFGHGLGDRQRQTAARLGEDHCPAVRAGGALPHPLLDARRARGGLRAPAVHCREGGEGSRAAIRLAPPAQREAVSFATSKLSSMSTLFGSVRKICRRVLFGTSLTRNETPLPARCCLMASKPRLPKAMWSMTPESGRCGLSVGEMSLRCSTGWPSL